MTVSILETLMNAEHNLTSAMRDHPTIREVAKTQLRRAIVLLEKGYSPYTEVDSLIEQHGSVEAVPECPDDE